MDQPLHVDHIADLGTAELLEVADGRSLVLGTAMMDRLQANRTAALRLLTSDGPVYGVTTGMGAASEIRLDEKSQDAHQDNLMLGRAVGSAPWLDHHETRAALAFRLRSFLSTDAAVSPGLCLHLVALLSADVVPAIPRSGFAAAGEIIPLAHLGALLTGAGQALVDGAAAPAVEALAGAGIEPISLGPKEGVAMLEGIPVTTAMAALAAREARNLLQQQIAALAAGLVMLRANTDPFRMEVGRADPELTVVLARIRDLVGAPAPGRTLQAPLSSRVAGPALAHLARAIETVDDAVVRAVDGVTDSPAYLDGRFVGTAGFDGFDLAASLHGLQVAVVHLAETSVARLHRLLDDRLTGLPRQLSAQPGLHAGMVSVHKRAAGVAHALVVRSHPSMLGAVETSLGQEDVQSFSLQTADICRTALDGTTEVLACELLGLVQATRLDPEDRLGSASSRLVALLGEVSDALPAGTTDRPFGRDVDATRSLLRSGWATG